MRHACPPPGAQKTCGFSRAAERTMARDAAGDCGAAETSTDSEVAEIASPFKALAWGAVEFGAGAAAERSLSFGGTLTELPARKLGSEPGGGVGAGGGAVGSSARAPTTLFPATLLS